MEQFCQTPTSVVKGKAYGLVEEHTSVQYWRDVARTNNNNKKNRGTTINWKGSCARTRDNTYFSYIPRGEIKLGEVMEAKEGEGWEVSFDRDKSLLTG
jgi:hypothetical protein